MNSEKPTLEYNLLVIMGERSNHLLVRNLYCRLTE